MAMIRTQAFQNLAMAFRSLDDYVTRVSITYVDDNGAQEVIDLGGPVGERMSVMCGLLTHWRLDDGLGNVLVDSGLQHGTTPEVNEESNMPLSGKVNGCDFVVSSDGHVIIRGLFIGMSQSNDQAMRMILTNVVNV